MNDSTSQGLVSPSDIADLAGVSRGAVSNWRKRSSDFPTPVAGTTAKPLFDRAEVESWLTATGKKVVTDQDLSAWSLLNTLRGELHFEDIAQLALDLACLRRIHETHDAPEDAWTAIQRANANTMPDALRLGVAELHDVLDLPDLPRRYLNIRADKVALILLPFQAVHLDELPAVTDYALARAASAQVRAGVEHGFVGSRVSVILANLAGATAEGVLYDPACGIGEALVRTIAAKRETAGSNYGAITRVVGHDINGDAVTTARQRAFLRGEQWDLEPGNVLRRDPSPDLKADVIVLEPPFGTRFEEGELSDPRWTFGMPPRTSSDMAWIQHAIAHLEPTGRAYVVTPLGVLFRAGQESAIRAELIRNRCVEAIIGLPGKLLPHVSTPLAIWVLCAPGQASREVLFIDASDSKAPEIDVISWLNQKPESFTPGPTQTVTTDEIATSGFDLNPVRWIAPMPYDPIETIHAYDDALTRLNRSLERVSCLDRPVPAFEPMVRPRIVTIGELIDGKVIHLKAGRAKSEETDRPVGELIVTTRHVRNGEFPPKSDGALDNATADSDLTMGGDVLVTTMNEIRTLLDPGGGSLPARGVYRLRVLTDQIDPSYLAAVLTGSWNNRFQTGTTIQRARIQDLEIPLISREEQALYMDAYERIAEVAEQARLLSQWANEVRAGLLDVLRTGVIRDRSAE